MLNILVVVGENLNLNASCTQCNRAYILGLIEAGYSVDVLTVSTDKKTLPKGANYYFYPADYFYHKLYRKIRYGKVDDSNSSEYVVLGKKHSDTKEIKIRKSIFGLISKMGNSIRGPYGASMAWSNRAQSFTSEKEYDLVLSLSWPTISHYTAEKLIKHKRIKTKKWCQIWEDPWAMDLYGKESAKVAKAEQGLLNNNCIILFVTPGTLHKQQEKYPQNAGKMDWLPLPSYYIREYQKTNNIEPVFSYFGDYYFSTRNLQPFYDAALKANIKTIICGNSDKPFLTIDNIEVHPRMNLEMLSKYEDRTDVLIFVANIGGGQIPGKIYQYSATNKIILFILDGTADDKDFLKNYFGKFNRFVFCENNTISIYNALLGIKEGKLYGINNNPILDFRAKNICEKIVGKCLNNTGNYIL